MTAGKALAELGDAGVLTPRRLPGGATCCLARAVFELLVDSEKQLASTWGDTRLSSPNRPVP